MIEKRSAPPTTVIKARKGWVPLNLSELVQYRELMFFLAWRDISVRYKQTVVGAGWAIIQPFLSMVVFSIFFGRFAQVPSDGVPYPIFSYAALLPWQYFSTSITGVSQSIVQNQRLVTKIYFPRLIIPIASVLPGLLDFVIAFLVLVGMMLYYDISFSLRLLVLLPLILLALVAALGFGLWIASLNVQYRDFRYVVPFVVQMWLFVSPVTYPLSIVPERWHVLYSINPMVGVIEGFRWALLNTETFDPMTIVLAVIVSVTLLVSGVYNFRRLEDTFADIV